MLPALLPEHAPRAISYLPTYCHDSKRLTTRIVSALHCYRLGVPLQSYLHAMCLGQVFLLHACLHTQNQLLCRRRQHKWHLRASE